MAKSIPQLSHKDRGRFESFFWKGTSEECWNWIGSTDKDRDQKGRQAQGEKNGRTKVLDSDIEEIRRLYKSKEYNLKELGTIFDLSEVHISDIVRNQFRKGK